jgi:hypothetical protein
MQRKLNWWYRLFHEGAHVALRLLSLVFSAASAMAIYWFFSALGDDRLRHVMTVGVAVGFAVLGYFVMRGLAFRILSKRRVRSYVLIGFLYLLVEVTCNLAYAVAQYPGIAWIHALHGLQFQVFSFLLLLVLSIMPLINIAMAVIDVDLMHEKGALGQMGLAQPKPGPAVFSTGGTRGAPGPVPQASYPPMVLQQGPPNALKSYWDQVRAAGGQVPPPTQMQGMGMNNASVP